MIRDPRLTQISVGKIISVDLDVMGLVKAICVIMHLVQRVSRFGMLISRVQDRGVGLISREIMHILCGAYNSSSHQICTVADLDSLKLLLGKIFIS